jgi:hypothetical protein
MLAETYGWFTEGFDTLGPEGRAVSARRIELLEAVPALRVQQLREYPLNAASPSVTAAQSLPIEPLISELARARTPGRVPRYFRAERPPVHWSGPQKKYGR